MCEGRQIDGSFLSLLLVWLGAYADLPAGRGPEPGRAHVRQHAHRPASPYSAAASLVPIRSVPAPLSRLKLEALVLQACKQDGREEKERRRACGDHPDSKDQGIMLVLIRSSVILQVSAHDQCGQVLHHVSGRHLLLSGRPRERCMQVVVFSHFSAVANPRGLRSSEKDHAPDRGVFLALWIIAAIINLCAK